MSELEGLFAAIGLLTVFLVLVVPLAWWWAGSSLPGGIDHD